MSSNWDNFYSWEHVSIRCELNLNTHSKYASNILITDIFQKGYKVLYHTNRMKIGLSLSARHNVNIEKKNCKH